MLKEFLYGIINIALTFGVLTLSWWLGIKGNIGFILGLAAMTYCYETKNVFIRSFIQYFQQIIKGEKKW